MNTFYCIMGKIFVWGIVICLAILICQQISMWLSRNRQNKVVLIIVLLCLSIVVGGTIVLKCTSGSYFAEKQAEKLGGK